MNKKQVMDLLKPTASTRKAIRAGSTGRSRSSGIRFADLRNLNAAALEAANPIGPIEYEDGGKCEPFDVASYLTKDHLKRRPGIQ